MSTILSLNNLSKKYRSQWTMRSRVAISDLSLDVYRGEALGFLGKNGAGKTTTLKCIMGLIKPSAGNILLEGSLLKSPAQYARVGYLPELPYFYDHLTVEETLIYFARLFGMWGAKGKTAVSQALEQVGLSERAHSKVRSLSKGLQQRMAFAAAIVNEPNLLILDEPFSGLDPIGRREMRLLLDNLRQEGCTLLICSHILSDIEELCNRVAIIDGGTLQTVFSLTDMTELFGQRFELTIVRESIPTTIINSICTNSTYEETKETNAGYVTKFEFDNYDCASMALNTATSANMKIVSFTAANRHLEDIFIKFTSAKAELQGVKQDCNNQSVSL